jgi:hypothetical protein
MTLLLPLLLAAAPFEQPPAKLPAGIDPALADWTPRPAQGKSEPWEKMTDKDWIDPRFRDMNTGPALNCTLRYPHGKGTEVAYKARAGGSPNETARGTKPRAVLAGTAGQLSRVSVSPPLREPAAR